MKMKTTEIGRLGETAVCRQLEQQGYSIVRRNFCVRGGEIDIIAENGEYLAFVEVKTRKPNRAAFWKRSVLKWCIRNGKWGSVWQTGCWLPASWSTLP